MAYDKTKVQTWVQTTTQQPKQTYIQTLTHELEQLGFTPIAQEIVQDPHHLEQVIDDASTHGFDFIKYMDGAIVKWFYREKLK